MAALLNLDLIMIKGNAAHAAKVKSRVWMAWHRNKRKETGRQVNCKLANEIVLWTVGSQNIKESNLVIEQVNFANLN